MSSPSPHRRHKKKEYRDTYRGTVVSNIDPMERGRLLVQVPDILGLDPCIWAASHSPMVGPGMGLYWVPPIGAGVYVVFEGGDPNQAVWTGCWRGGPQDIPMLAHAAIPGNPPIIICSLAQNTIAISDGPLPPGIATTGIMIQSGPSSIVISPDGITITSPNIKINGLTIINGGALQIT